MANIFLSYNRQSESIARTLAVDLEALDHTVWFDQKLSGGQVWWDQILAQIRDCHIFAFVLDQQSLGSTACKREFGYAAELGKPILPILVSEDVSVNLLPPALTRIHFVDYRKQDRDAAFRLVKAITALPSPPPLPDHLPPAPEVPVSYLVSLTEQVDMTANLSFEQQSALVVDLKKFWRDPATTGDARMLLERLRKRHDLFAAIAEEIDALLEKLPKGPNDPSDVSDKPPPPDPKPTRLERMKGALVLAVIGGVAQTGFGNILHGSEGLLFPFTHWFFYFLPLSGAIAGAICAMNRRGIGAAIVGLVVAVVSGHSFQWPGSYFGMLITLLASPLGAVVGVYKEKSEPKSPSLR